MAARVAVVIVALALAAFGIAARQSSHDCTDAGKPFFRVAFREQTRLTPAQVRAFADACRGSHFLALGASFLAAHDQPQLGIALARIATRREPDNFEGWLALSRALRAARLEQSANRAEQRALALNPRLARTLPRPG